ncbi:hypothetical protein FB45DRAFT_875627 [Roridomyces roridus]|uniref:Uncharacterized protein n=1 Tax=Roridomyces roridus TaxID=1738132 RepID=A0AAD7FBW4_9AGAR|nr:hypothetical protein FB45DRAFT_875627 [Roridomyces roridus]
MADESVRGGGCEIEGRIMGADQYNFLPPFASAAVQLATPVKPSCASLKQDAPLLQQFQASVFSQTPTNENVTQFVAMAIKIALDRIRVFSDPVDIMRRLTPSNSVDFEGKGSVPSYLRARDLLHTAYMTLLDLMEATHTALAKYFLCLRQSLENPEIPWNVAACQEALEAFADCGGYKFEYLGCILLRSFARDFGFMRRQRVRAEFSSLHTRAKENLHLLDENYKTLEQKMGQIVVIDENIPATMHPDLNIGLDALLWAEKVFEDVDLGLNKSRSWQKEGLSTKSSTRETRDALEAHTGTQSTLWRLGSIVDMNPVRDALDTNKSRSRQQMCK